MEPAVLIFPHHNTIARMYFLWPYLIPQRGLSCIFIFPAAARALTSVHMTDLSMPLRSVVKEIIKTFSSLLKRNTTYILLFLPVLLLTMLQTIFHQDF